MNNYCEYIHKLFNSIERINFPFDKSRIPSNGIYVLFEEGEKAHNVDRIVRVGTHTGKNQLYSRINQHFIIENKYRSIFRKNIGRAFLNKNNDIFLVHWEIDLTTKEAKEKYLKEINLKKLMETEKIISEYIQKNFSFIVFEIDNKEKRLLLESKIISTVSLCQNCKQSEKWLGNYSTREKIIKSGLWLVNELWKTELNEDDINYLKLLLERGNGI